MLRFAMLGTSAASAAAIRGRAVRGEEGRRGSTEGASDVPTRERVESAVDGTKAIVGCETWKRVRMRMRMKR